MPAISRWRSLIGSGRAAAISAGVRAPSQWAARPEANSAAVAVAAGSRCCWASVCEQSSSRRTRWQGWSRLGEPTGPTHYEADGMKVGRSKTGWGPRALAMSLSRGFRSAVGRVVVAGLSGRRRFGGRRRRR